MPGIKQLLSCFLNDFNPSTSFLSFGAEIVSPMPGSRDCFYNLDEMPA